jgi:hypothetical protein
MGLQVPYLELQPNAVVADINQYLLTDVANSEIMED